MVDPSEQTSALASTNGAGDRTSELLVATLTGLAALGVYLATLYPGLTEIGDASKFAFVGRVLGIPHPPGYPLYVVVSHLFSYLPIGTLAYRMNAMSAVFGAVAVALSYLIARRLGVNRTIAISTALALAFGQAFWSQALYAKGYTLNAALISGGMLVLLRWSDERRVSLLYWAAAIFALSFGNHLTMIALLPAIVLFTLSTDPRMALRPRTLLVVLGIVLVGVAQYGFIVLRTWQRAPFLEASASNLGELWDVMTARRFAGEIGAYTLSDLASTRVPFVARLLSEELGVAGVLLLCAGLALLLVRRPRLALLFGLGALSVVALTASMSTREEQGFLLSTFILLWPIAGLGLQGAVTALRWIPPRPAIALTLTVAAVMPIGQLIRNYHSNNHRGDTSETIYFNALFAALPPKTAIVSDQYRLYMMVLYKLLGERAAGTRDIRHVLANATAVTEMLQDGYDVIAFNGAAGRLRDSGFRLAPFTIDTQGIADNIVRQRQLFRVVSAPACLAIGNTGWVDISETVRMKGQMQARIDNFRPFDASLIIYAGADRSPAPVIVGARGSSPPSLAAEIFPRGDADAQRRLAAQIAADGVTLPEEMRRHPFVARVEVGVNDGGTQSLFGLDFGPGVRAAVGRAQVDSDAPNRATVCSHSLAGVDGLALGERPSIILLDAADVQFDDGWHAIERGRDGLASRWMAYRAVLLIPLDHPRAATVAIEAASGPQSRDVSLALIVNGHELESFPLSSRRRRLSWRIPDMHLRDGLNELVFKVDGVTRPPDVAPGRRLLGASVTRIELADAVAAP